MQAAGGLEARQRSVCGVGLGPAEMPPAQEAARPVALAHCVMRDKISLLHRWLAFPGARAVAVIRDAGVGAASCAGEHHQPLALAAPVGETGPGVRELARRFAHNTPTIRPLTLKVMRR